MGMFSGFNSSKPTGGGGVYLNPGHEYLLEVRNIQIYQGRNGDFWITEFRIHESNDPMRPAGSQASWLVKMGQDMTFPNIRAFLAAVNGIDPSDTAAVESEITEEVAELAVTSRQPLRGRLVECSVVLVKTKKGDDFSKHVWRPTGRDPVLEAVPEVKRNVVAPPSSPRPAAAPPPPPVAVAAPPPPPAFPPLGWSAHPTAPGWFFRGQEVVSEADLRARVASGR